MTQRTGLTLRFSLIIVTLTFYTRVCIISLAYALAMGMGKWRIAWILFYFSISESVKNEWHWTAFFIWEIWNNAIEIWLFFFLLMLGRSDHGPSTEYTYEFPLPISNFSLSFACLHVPIRMYKVYVSMFCNIIEIKLGERYLVWHQSDFEY